MAATAFELAAVRRYDDSENPSAEREWMVVGSANYSEAYSAVDAAAPATITLPSGKVVAIDSFTVQELRDEEGAMKFVLRYVAQPRPAANEEEYEFDMSAPTERVFYSLATTAVAPAGKTAPNFGGAIGVQNGVPQGIEPYQPLATFRITKHWPTSIVNQAFQVATLSYVGTCNDVNFRGMAAGSLRVMGVRGRRNGDKFPVSYEFGWRPNIIEASINGMTVSADGWQIIDPYYETLADTTAKKLVQRARAVYVHRIHRRDTWAFLGL